jgi:polysaccharide export outer membrane protein
MAAVACATTPSPAVSPAGPATPAAGSPGPGPGPSRAGSGRGPGAPAPPAVSLSAPAAEAADDYKLAPGDQITIQVHAQEDLTRTLRVSEGGTITFPFLGEVAVGGRSVKEVEQALETGLRGGYLLQPKVNVAVTEYRGRQFAVMGAVQQPGSFALKTNYTTLLGALSEAKGVRENADRVAYVVRARPRAGEPQPVAVDLDTLMRTGDPRQNVVVEAGDAVYVPEANAYYVAGEVEKRGAYTLRRETTVSKALTEAGGVTKRAGGEVKIIRTLPTGERREMGGIDLKAVMAGDRTQDVTLQPQDVVVVPASGAKVAGYAFLDVLKSLLKFSLIAF